MMSDLYLHATQARQRAPTHYEDLLGDAIERSYAAGIHDLAGLVQQLNAGGPPCPAGTWTELSFQAEIARLANDC
jgi:hypothetical protein